MSPNLLLNNQIRPPIEIFRLILHWIFPYSEVSPLAPPLYATHDDRHQNLDAWKSVTTSTNLPPLVAVFRFDG